MVNTHARAPTAVLVVTAWREGAPSRIAARITYTLDVTREEGVTVTAGAPDAITRVVRDWLRQVGSAASTGDASVTEE